jgi:hypothetical protein
MKPLSRIKQQKLQAQLDMIAAAGRPALLTLWTEMIGRSPPNNISLPILRKALAFETQIKTYGTLPKVCLKQLNAKGHGGGTTQTCQPAHRLKPGTRLVREWHGRTFHVQVEERGFVMKDKTYRSLSAIAREITGAQWSGPRFFGLKNHQHPPRQKEA